MSVNVLLVDDDPNLLAACRRSLGRHFPLATADGGAAGLEKIRRDGSYGVVVSDMRMPGIDGIEFIQAAREIAPDAVYLMLTGNTDQATAVDAVNRGQIFRFLNKPCQPETMTEAIDAAVRQHELITAERVLLRETLTGSMRVLTDLMSLTYPRLFDRAGRVQSHVRAMAKSLSLHQAWQYELAAMLASVGVVTLAPETVDRWLDGGILEAGDAEAVASRHAIGKRLLEHIPRLQGVAEIIGSLGEVSQLDPEVALADRSVTAVVGAQLILAAERIQQTLEAPFGEDPGWDTRLRDEGCDVRIVKAAVRIHKRAREATQEFEVVEVPVRHLRPGMRMAEELTTNRNVLLVAEGQDLTEALIERIQNLGRLGRVQERTRVVVRRGTVKAAKE